MYKVEKHHPMPEFNTGRGVSSGYPFCSMQIGDSFFMKYNPLHSFDLQHFLTKTKNNISAAAVSYRKKHNSKARFLCALGQDGIYSGVRVWRVE